jgi:predicted metal-binding membrane protein
MLVMTGFMFVALRFGLLAYVVAATVVDLWLRNPLSTDLSTFRGQPTLLVSAVILAAALFAYRQLRRADPSLAGR